MDNDKKKEFGFPNFSEAKKLVNINIEIPDDLHKKIKLACIVNDVTLKDYILGVLEKKSKECKTKV